MRVFVSCAVFVLLLTSAAPAQESGEKGPPTAVLLGGPEVGRRAPDFTLPWAGRDGVGPADSPYQLWRDRGKTVVIAFYPRDFTSGCTAQMRTFTEQYDSLFGGDVVVVGISADSLSTHSRFAARLEVPFRLLSDPDQKVARKYGSHGTGGRPRRTVFVVGPDGQVKYRNMKFNALDPTHYAELSSAVRTARGG
ncbi:MAG TPA: peroxiredoxin [Gemmatimonadales bacterium]